MRSFPDDGKPLVVNESLNFRVAGRESRVKSRHEKEETMTESGPSVSHPQRALRNVGGCFSDYFLFEVLLGRPISAVGAHCHQDRMNHRGIGVCFVGNYDLEPPQEGMLLAAAPHLAELCRQHEIPIRNIHPHSDHAPKTCPGKKFSMDWLRSLVATNLAKVA